jgi:hypothetical protein
VIERRENLNEGMGTVFPLENALTSVTFGYLVHKSMSRKVASAKLSWITIILKVSLSALQPQIRTYGIDVNSNLAKGSHHAVFDEAWYLQPSQPPVVQFLFDLGLQEDDKSITLAPLPDSPHPLAPFPPLPKDMKSPLPVLPCHALHAHLPLCESSALQTVTAWVALITAPSHLYEGMKIRPSWDARAVSDYHINSKHDVKQVYFSPTAYNKAFEEILDMRRLFTTALPSGGMQFIMVEG